MMDTINRVAIEWDCSQVLLNFYDRFDRFDYQGMKQLFTVDGVWHRAGKALQANDDLIAELSTRSQTQIMRHVITNLIVQAKNPESAEATCYLTTYRFDDGKPQIKPPVISCPNLFLVVSVSFVLTTEGWRIREQTMKREFEFADRP